MTLGTTVTIIAVAFFVSAIIGVIIIPLLRRLKFGQSIREEGPQAHLKKAGTPTMGGLIFLLSILISTLTLSYINDTLTTHTIVLLIVLVGFGIIGFLDDFIIIVAKRNLGLTSLQKLIGQIIIAIVAFFLLKLGPFETTVMIPFTEMGIDLGVFYVAFLVFWLVGFSNAVNLTDGLDGLVGGTSTIAFSAFGVFALAYEQNDIALFAFVVAGAMLGFLLFNIKPAKVFMGDTGSLALGGALAMISVLIKQELLLLIIGIVFVVETLSVIIQVISFKMTGKRVFKMSPIHHHFELSGWSEWKVVIVFWGVALLAALVPVFLEVM
ncbi:phospho-N-acetylmuramoyl-pentapeptide-transferase [Sporosarcina sp. P21c]|uniref:phospho-N-acetylmuramoyl-pentapeptide- transferase n=1 Tax=Sporosarcina TaxID=1569 RepID=UPI000A14B120|nr:MULTISPECIES: phospho-N-acetylmuramoyl-pentapeptide-transferase [Sporosarcina]ARJ39956.1 phospho-N-acetylmuramoyl-pentapeptide-transferase [Sporosarcina ureae]PIC68849.1 phospho-N-acetylmuramoyl-pentapeptide-transferase [Sporosarcina sp. P16a]PIC84382.1 phospho-N-acetylmuramoyl-pentapeptide-transferase [Sporosarcina sp. P1]PIC90033.1 phospho-N-acetylmuramoyl-pentapeptide-transferase [Sporosarcina sp. P21c]PIC91595.1 phospho-N-acetylmuramoyl-pentapeptide-transferase [Sporosarcina sp. P25]